MTQVRYPDIEVQLSGVDGNAFMIIGLVQEALREADVAPKDVSELLRSPPVATITSSADLHVLGRRRVSRLVVAARVWVAGGASRRARTEVCQYPTHSGHVELEWCPTLAVTSPIGPELFDHDFGEAEPCGRRASDAPRERDGRIVHLLAQAPWRSPRSAREGDDRERHQTP